MIEYSRLEEIKTLLESMNNRNKTSSDGLGIYLGDGIPRKQKSLRSGELLDIVNELIGFKNGN